MVAALALLSLLIVSLTVVRIGGTALRLTGMSMQSARFQAISALTGTGFTTQEAETTMHHPVRRRILIMLMFTGHLGVVSLASTVILGVSSAANRAIARTLLYMVLAVVVICALAMSQTLDRVMCAIVGHVLIRLGWFEVGANLVLLELPNGDMLVEHELDKGTLLGTLEAAHKGVTFLSVNGKPFAKNGSGTIKLAAGDRLVCFAPVETQQGLLHALNGR
jgi:hypothetical protein